MTDDVVWKKEAWKNRSNISRIRELVMTDENATNIEKMKVVTLTEIHDQLWWLALIAKIAISLLLFEVIVFMLWVRLLL
jgi:hypothetical protein